MEEGVSGKNVLSLPINRVTTSSSSFSDFVGNLYLDKSKVSKKETSEKDSSPQKDKAEYIKKRLSKLNESTSTTPEFHGILKELKSNGLDAILLNKISYSYHKMEKQTTLLKAVVAKRDETIKTHRKDYIKELNILREELFRSKKGGGNAPKNFIISKFDRVDSPVSLKAKHGISISQRESEGDKLRRALGYQSNTRLSASMVLQDKLKMERLRTSFMKKKQAELAVLRERNALLKTEMTKNEEMGQELQKKLTLVEDREIKNERISKELMQKKLSLSDRSSLVESKEVSVDQKLESLKVKEEYYNSLIKEEKTKKVKKEERELAQLRQMKEEESDRLEKLKESIKSAEEKFRITQERSMKVFEKNAEIQKHEQKQKMLMFQAQTQALVEKQSKLMEVIAASENQLSHLTITVDDNKDLSDEERKSEEERLRKAQEEAQREKKKMDSISSQINNFQSEFKTLFSKIDVVKNRMAFYTKQNSSRSSRRSSRSGSPRSIIPRGKVTLVFTDIQSSTHLWERGTKMMRDAMIRHNNLIREIIFETEGYEVKTEGDSFMIAYSDPVMAMKFALQAQLRLMECNWSEALLAEDEGKVEIDDVTGEKLYRGVRVRMGINIGKPIMDIDPVTKRGDYFGPVVNRAARIEGFAVGGAIAIGEKMFKTLKPELSSDELQDKMFGCRVHMLCLGKKFMKGVEESVKIWYVFPEKLRNRKFRLPKSNFDSGKDNLETLIKQLHKSRERLELKRERIYNRLNREVKLKALQDSNVEQHTIIEYMRNKLDKIKNHFKEGGDERNQNVGELVEGEHEAVMTKYLMLMGQHKVMKNNFDTVEKMFDDRLKTQLNSFSTEITRMRTIVKRTENRNTFERRAWDVERNIYVKKVRKFSNMVKRKELYIKDLQSALRKYTSGNAPPKPLLVKQPSKRQVQKAMKKKNYASIRDQKKRNIENVKDLINGAINNAIELQSPYKQMLWEDDLIVAKEELDMSSVLESRFSTVPDDSDSDDEDDEDEKKPKSLSQCLLNLAKFSTGLLKNKNATPQQLQRKREQLHRKLADVKSRFSSTGNKDDGKKEKTEKRHWHVLTKMVKRLQRQDTKLKELIASPVQSSPAKNSLMELKKRITTQRRPHTSYSSRSPGYNLSGNRGSGRMFSRASRLRMMKIKKKRAQSARIRANTREKLKNFQQTIRKNKRISYSRLLRNFPSRGTFTNADALKQFKKRNGIIMDEALVKEKERLMEKLYYSKNEKKYQNLVPVSTVNQS